MNTLQHVTRKVSAPPLSSTHQEEDIPAQALISAPGMQKTINPATLTPAAVMQLQRTIGNQAVNRLIAAHTSAVQRSATPSEASEDSHTHGCRCPSCTGPQVRDSSPLQRSMASNQIQRKPCPECGKPKGHLSGCSRHKNRRGVIRQEQQKVNKERSSWGNMKDYRSGWIKRNNITKESVLEFCRQYQYRKIRGHASGDNSMGEQDNTKNDLNAYKSWHTQTYGGWYG